MTDPADIVRATTIGRRAPIGRIRYAAERITAVLDRDADPAVNLIAVRTILEGVADELESAPEFPLPIRADGSHHYVSTYCAHSDHAACRLRCKSCPAPCECTCHDGDRCSTCGTVVAPYGMVRHRRAVHATTEQLAEDGPGNDAELTRAELQDLVEDLGQEAYRAQDLLAYIGEMCDAADRDGSPVTTERVRTWLRYTGCGGMLVLPEAGAPADGADAAPGSDVLARIRQAWVDAEDGWDRLAAVGMDGDRWRRIVVGERRATSLDCALVAEAFEVGVDWVLYGDVLPAPATSDASGCSGGQR